MAVAVDESTNRAYIANHNSGNVTVSITRHLPAPSARARSSSAGSIDFIAADIITKATVPSNNAITQQRPETETAR